MPPRWPARAIGAIVSLFRPLQDLDVYVEDKGSEHFYKALLERIIPANIRIQRIFPLDGKMKVLAQAANHDFRERPALYVIDGDFDWVRGEEPPNTLGVYRLEAYCVENLLICEHAAAEVLMECEACSEADAKRALAFDNWIVEVDPLVDLFIAWAAVNVISPTTPTTGTGIGRFIDGSKRTTKIDHLKITKARQDAHAVVSVQPGGTELLQRIEQRVRRLPFRLDTVSGKDFVLPALEFHLRTLTREKCSRKALKFRLARRAAADRLAGLAAAVLRAARGENMHA